MLFFFFLVRLLPLHPCCVSLMRCLIKCDFLFPFELFRQCGCVGFPPSLCWRLIGQTCFLVRRWVGGWGRGGGVEVFWAVEPAIVCRVAFAFEIRIYKEWCHIQVVPGVWRKSEFGGLSALLVAVLLGPGSGAVMCVCGGVFSITHQ